MSLPPPPPQPPGRPAPGPFAAPGTAAPFQGEAPRHANQPQYPYSPSSYPPGQYQGGPYGDRPFAPQATGTIRKVNPLFSISGVVCGVLVALGSVLPWATIDFGFDRLSVKGLDADGRITIVLGFAAAGVLVVSIVNGATWSAITALALFALTAVVALVDIADIASVSGADSGLLREAGLDTTVGVGLILVLIAGLAGVVVCIVGILARKVRG